MKAEGRGQRAEGRRQKIVFITGIYIRSLRIMLSS
jgi:hypothetical protein